ncbi:MAG TPA: glycosyltransferase family 2 protein [bacterium]|nr:glycosyltransferase family 2 protein [bacterium]
MRISVLIPVYREPKFLADILAKLLKNTYPDKEILVIIDGQTNREIEQALEPYRNKVRVYENGARRGKANSLNFLSEQATGEVLLFLDNDVELPEEENFLSQLSQEIAGYDLLELSKEAIAQNFFSRITSYDFLSGSILCLLVSRIFRKSLFLSGAAFAIRKETFQQLGKFSRVISEDWDLMLKAFRARKSYWFSRRLKVKTMTPTNFEEWLQQRNRWALGMSYWWQEILKDIRLYLKSLPIIMNILLFAFFPALVGLLLLRIHFFSWILPLLILISQHLTAHVGVSSGLYLLSLIGLLLQGAGPFLVSLVISVTTFFIFSRLLKFRFSLWEYLLYSLGYFPFLLFFYILYFVLGKLLQPGLDWQME